MRTSLVGRISGGARTHACRVHTRADAPGQECVRHTQSGITLIEMMVVVTIIALFAGVVAPQVLKHLDRAKIAAAAVQIHDFETALAQYKMTTGAFPATEQGLQALRVAPDGVSRWDGPYLPKDIPLDPWHHAYAYKYPGEHGDEPDIMCYGADGQPGGDGINADIVSWKN